MTRNEFLHLRDLPEKSITADIIWRKERGTGPNKIFNRILVKNSLGLSVWLNGTYKPALLSVTYNFVLVGTGPICRLDVNGTIHGSAGRTHKHDLHNPEDADPENNLPMAVARPDLNDKNARQVWDVLCRQANIAHLGRFIDP